MKGHRSIASLIEVTPDPLSLIHDTAHNRMMVNLSMTTLVTTNLHPMLALTSFTTVDFGKKKLPRTLAVLEWWYFSRRVYTVRSEHFYVSVSSTSRSASLLLSLQLGIEKLYHERMFFSNHRDHVKVVLSLEAPLPFSSM